MKATTAARLIIEAYQRGWQDADAAAGVGPTVTRNCDAKTMDVYKQNSVLKAEIDELMEQIRKMEAGLKERGNSRRATRWGHE